MKRLWLLLTALLGLGLWAPAAKAASVSYSVWNVEGPVVRVRVILPMGEAAALAPNLGRMDTAAVAAAAGPMIGASAAGGDCEAQVQDQWVGKYYLLAIAQRSYRFEVRLLCPSARAIVLHDHVLFDKAPDHIDYASVQVGPGAPTLRLFTRAHQDTALPTAGPAPAESLGPFIDQGLRRLLQGADAAALVLGLLLLARGWGDLLGVAAALAAGYACALLAALSGAVAADLTLAEAGIAGAVAVVGVCALRLQLAEQPVERRWLLAGGAAAGLAAAAIVALAAQKGVSAAFVACGLLVFGAALAWLAGLAPNARRLLLAPAALFGLLDGARWVQALAPLRLPGAQVATALFGYGLGALVALGAASVAAMALMWLARRRLAPLRPLGADVAAAGVTGVGLFLFVSRFYGA